MSTRSYNIPAFDTPITVEYIVRRNGDVELSEVWFRDELMDAEALFMPYIHANGIKTYVSVAQYLQTRLNEDAPDILADDEFSHMAAE